MEVIYTMKIENIGAVVGSVVLKDNIPEQLNTKKIAATTVTAIFFYTLNM